MNTIKGRSGLALKTLMGIPFALGIGDTVIIEYIGIKPSKKGNFKMRLIHTQNEKIFSSEALANILQKDHYDLRCEIRNVPQSAFGQAYAMLEGSDASLHDFYAKNYDMRGDSLFMTEEGLWRYLWSLESPIPSEQIEKILRYISSTQNHNYVNNVRCIIREFLEAVTLMDAILKKTCVLRKPRNFTGHDHLPDVVRIIIKHCGIEPKPPLIADSNQFADVFFDVQIANEREEI